MKLKKPVKVLVRKPQPAKPAELARSKLAVFDVPVNLLVAHKANPNEQDEKIFDELVERIRKDGVDEPIIVVPELADPNTKNKDAPRGYTGKYLIVSGHHRAKAAEACGLASIPAIVREGWDDDRVKIELISRNHLRGQLNPHKFTELFDSLKNRYDPEILKRQMGFTAQKEFNALYKHVRDQLPEKAKAKLDNAKERINSIEDLSSVLNEIFREHGNDTDHSLMVFSYGKSKSKHVYVQVDKVALELAEELKTKCEDENVSPGAVISLLLKDKKAVDNVIGAMKRGKA
jgi:hypothetical protein